MVLEKKEASFKERKQKSTSITLVSKSDKNGRRKGKFQANLRCKYKHKNPKKISKLNSAVHKIYHG